MRFFRTGILVLVVLLAGAAVAFAATDTASHDVVISITDIAMLGVFDPGAGTDVNLSTVDPVTAGQDPTGNTGTARLHYTSLAPSGSTRHIQAYYDGGADTEPAGTNLLLTAAPAALEGSTAGQISVPGTLAGALDIVTGVASVATGTTAADGAVLTYELDVIDAALLDTAGGQTITIFLILTEAIF